MQNAPMKKCKMPQPIPEINTDTNTEIINQSIPKKEVDRLIEKYSLDYIKEMLGLSDKTVKKAVDELKDFGLIEEEHMGLNKANRIYLTSVNVENTGIGETPIPESE